MATTSMRRAGKVEYKMLLRPLYEKPADIHASVGAVVNLDNRHWVALRSVGGEIWYLDSNRREIASKVAEPQYAALVNKRRAAYPIQWADGMTASLPSASSSADSPCSPVLALASLDTPSL